jgi:hypothetical protein
MQPVELLARLLALIPPPRHPLLRFHGALAPHSSWRKNVVPEPAVADAAQSSACQTTTSVVESVGPAVTEPPSRQMVEVLEAIGAVGDRRAAEPRAAPSLGAVEAVLDPKRLLAAPKRTPFEPGKPRYTSGAWRIDWATLLKRVGRAGVSMRRARAKPASSDGPSSPLSHPRLRSAAAGRLVIVRATLDHR